MDLLEGLQPLDEAPTSLCVSLKGAENRSMLLLVGLVHRDHRLHVLKDGASVRRALGKEQVVHVEYEVLKSVVAEDGLLHLFEGFLEGGGVIFHCWFGVEHSLAEANGDLKLG